LTVETTTARVQYATNGTTGPWTVPFYFLADEHLQVIHTDEDGNETVLAASAYSVTGAGVESGGSVATDSAYVAGGYITILRSIEPLQETDLVDGDSLPAETLETAFDKLTMLAQQTLEVAGRALVFSPSDTSGSTLPAAVARASKLLGFDSDGVLSLNTPADGSAAALALLLASSANAVEGAGMVGFDTTRAYAASTTGAKLKEWVSVDDYWSGSGDYTDAANAALVAASQIRFLAGRTYALSDDILIPSNRKIIVEKGATVTNTGGRFTAYDVDNVEFVVDGQILSVGMTLKAYKSGWPNTTEATATHVERGFIEFGSATPASPRRGFRVSGSGVIGGDWTGTPAAPTNDDLNCKGIAVWNASDVLIEDVLVRGFRGEAVYCYGVSVNCVNWTFRNVHSYDSKFNALNFNAIGPKFGLRILRCLTRYCYTGIEMSVGEAEGNTCFDPEANGIWTGVGSGTGPITLRGNTVHNAGALSFYAGFASAIGPVIVEDNTSINPAAGAFQLGYATQFSCRRNLSVGHSQTVAAYAYAYVQSTDGVIDGNVTLAPGGSSLGARFVDLSTVPVCSDLTIGCDLTPTSTTAVPQIYGGMPTVASASTVTLPDDVSAALISGTTNITSITAAGNKGREVRLVFAGVLTFTDGSNLKLAGNFVTTADDTISLVCDGTNWYELARSVN
jgi:hypothetical protein